MTPNLTFNTNISSYANYASLDKLAQGSQNYSYASTFMTPLAPQSNYIDGIGTSFMLNNFGSMDSFSTPFGTGVQPALWDLLNSKLEDLTSSYKSGTEYYLGIPDSGYIKQKKGSMPLSKTCQAQVEVVAKRIGANPKDLQALIYSESGGNPQAINKLSGASGLIQFMPKTARWLGTSIENIRRMSAEQQMVYVEKYLLHMKKSAGFAANHKLSAGELYAIVFMPAKAKSAVLCSRGSLAYEQNKGLDKHNTGQVTINSLGDRLRSYYNYVTRHSQT